MAVANIYYAQPLLPSMALTLKLTATRAGLLVTVAQLSYALGLLFIVPLGDLFERRAPLACSAWPGRPEPWQLPARGGWRIGAGATGPPEWVCWCCWRPGCRWPGRAVPWRP